MKGLIVSLQCVDLDEATFEATPIGSTYTCTTAMTDTTPDALHRALAHVGRLLAHNPRAQASLGVTEPTPEPT